MAIEVELSGGLVDHVEGPCELVWGNRQPCDLYPLGWFDQVWGGIESGVDAFGAQAGFNHRAGGAFAVCAGDVNGSVRALGVAQGLKQSGDSLQTELGGE